MAHEAGASPSFSSMKGLQVFLLPLDGMLVHHRVTPRIKFAGTHLYTMMQRTTNENAAGLHRICKRSDQPKIENNDARLILRRKLKGKTI